ncbi:UPF0175 family protein [Pyrodictium abyssi]|uniref:Uncharacterized protein n=1 Tax=Pyrodictium abyssi TaxID=54256 RepID=A0ABM8IY20_9CREN|nr:hypothetical protein PABY_06300 [Pyrodictium abyssi]
MHGYAGIALRGARDPGAKRYPRAQRDSLAWFVWAVAVAKKRGALAIVIPEDIVAAAKAPGQEFERVARIELAVALYAHGIPGLGQARRLAGLSKRASSRS